MSVCLCSVAFHPSSSCFMCSMEKWRCTQWPGITKTRAVLPAVGLMDSGKLKVIL